MSRKCQNCTFLHAKLIRARAKFDAAHAELRERQARKDRFQEERDRRLQMKVERDQERLDEKYRNLVEKRRKLEEESRILQQETLELDKDFRKYAEDCAVKKRIMTLCMPMTSRSVQTGESLSGMVTLHPTKAQKLSDLSFCTSDDEDMEKDSEDEEDD